MPYNFSDIKPDFVTEETTGIFSKNHNKDVSIFFSKMKIFILYHFCTFSDTRKFGRPDFRASSLGPGIGILTPSDFNPISYEV